MHPLAVDWEDHTHTVCALLLQQGMEGRGRRDTDEDWKPVLGYKPDPPRNTEANECSQESVCVAQQLQPHRTHYPAETALKKKTKKKKGGEQEWLSKYNKWTEICLGYYKENIITHTYAGKCLQIATVWVCLCVSSSVREWSNSLSTVGRNDSGLQRAHSH